ncbi:uncharacterized protein LOC143297703 [Babylonia areolata]|uniref:uncharacterized protein LOC143297703 n=1 Tax=Babylonia areolata TaxID=304850 RepID=UPI003FD55730
MDKFDTTSSMSSSQEQQKSSPGGKSEEGGQGLRGLLSDFTQDTSMHGLGRVVSSRYLWLRGLWALFVLAAAGTALYNVANVVMTYSQYPVATVVSLEYTSKVAFPAVTVCNLNMLRKSQWEKNAFLSQLQNSDSDPTPTPLTPTPANTPTSQPGTTDADNDDYYDYSNYDYGDFFDPQEAVETDYKVQDYLRSLDKKKRQDFGHQLENMLIHCSYHIFNCSEL